MIRSKMRAIIDKHGQELNELKEAIKIPRKFYKIQDNMKYDHIIQQKNHILEKLKDQILNFSIMNQKLPPKKNYISV